MRFNRRRIFSAFAGAASVGAAPAHARSRILYDEVLPQPRATAEMDVASFGVMPSSELDQSTNLQRAITTAATAGSLLRFGPGVYRAGGLRLPSNAAIAGVKGSTRLVLSAGPSLFTSAHADYINLIDLVLDGNHLPLADERGLVHLSRGRAIRIVNCMVINAGGNAIRLESIAGNISETTVIDAADCAIFSNNAAGLRIAGNTIQNAGNTGIAVYRSTPGDDGTLVVDNRIENTKNKSGGTGQWGNAIGVFRADNVMVRGNRIREAAYSAVRGNTAGNFQIVGNTCSGIGETALYAEFGFNGAVVANNIVDGAAVGVGLANFQDHGGRLATVQGNLIRNLHRGRPDRADVEAMGISAEADAAITGNVIENVQGPGIIAGWGSSLRDVVITGNLVRGATVGVAISVVPEAGTVVVANNFIAETPQGAIVGREWDKTVTGDLSKDGAARYSQLTINDNRIR
ncbi:MAG TPA: TIGR03808 family TAT-translocated repetitive protein [Xanthobacteraceae bacterium]|nr:TIGR03808 family TAT-translocated repetitive protein [Xanthobacteraceae bacterium]